LSLLGVLVGLFGSLHLARHLLGLDVDILLGDSRSSGSIGLLLGSLLGLGGFALLRLASSLLGCFFGCSSLFGLESPCLGLRSFRLPGQSFALLCPHLFSASLILLAAFLSF